jgi:hypothetical protein
MLHVIIAMSLLFIAIGFIVTEKNAKYLLSGYNTMSDAARQQFNLKAYLTFFRKFHLFLGASLMLIGLSVNYIISENAGGLFIGIYPLAAYTYFAIVSSRYSKGIKTKTNRIGGIILAVTLLLVIGLLSYGYRENKLIVNTNAIEITGFYGETINSEEIKSIKIVENMPEIRYKSNGFALGTIRKGYFKTKEGSTLKLILNANNKPYLLITKTDGKKIYFSAKKTSAIELLDKIKNTLPGVYQQ